MIKELYKDVRTLFYKDKRMNPNLLFDVILLFMLLATKLDTEWWDPMRGPLATIISFIIFILSLKVILSGRDVKVVKIYKTKKTK